MFIDAFAKTGDVAFSAAKAGWANRSAGYKMLEVPAVRDAINARRDAQDLLTAAAPRVVQEHLKRMLDAKTTNREFAQLVGTYYKHAGLAADGERKELHEMNGEELAKLADAIRRRASDLAKPVIEHEADQAPIESVFD